MVQKAHPVTTSRERFLEAILHSAVEYAIISLDLDGLITSWNVGAERILGWAGEEAIGLPGSVRLMGAGRSLTHQFLMVTIKPTFHDIPHWLRQTRPVY